MASQPEPDVCRRFVLSDLTGNHNKLWQVLWWQDGTYVVEYGRVGQAAQKRTKTGVTREWLERKVSEQVREGYCEVELHRPPAASAPQAVTTDPRVVALMDFVAREAAESIQTYSAVPVDGLSQRQIRQGRTLLDELRRQPGGSPNRRAELVEAYLNTVPTRMPFRDLRDLRGVDWFVNSIAERYAQLDQLEANLAVHTATALGNTSVFAGLDVEIEPFDPHDEDRAVLHRYVMGTAHPGSRVCELYRVKIRPERAAFERETVGKGHVASLFHGTRSHNLQKILRTGLIIPPVAANGSRFGRGIYLADQFRRSQNYAGSASRPWKAVFVCDAALGRAKVLENDAPHLSGPPAGYDSVRGVKSYSGMDEFVCYRPSQVTVRALAILE